MKCLTQRQIKDAYRAAMAEIRKDSGPGRGDYCRLRREGVKLFADALEAQLYWANDYSGLGEPLHAHGKTRDQHVRNERQDVTANVKSRGLSQ